MMSSTPIQQPVTANPGDPTPRTTEQLWREIEHITERMDIRFDAMDKAIVLLQEFANRSPTNAVLDQRLNDFSSKVELEFIGVQKQFNERDTRTDLSSKNSASSVSAALAAAEKLFDKQNEYFAETMEKSERSITKEIDAVKSRIDQNIKISDDKIMALDKRLTEMNGRDKGVAASWGVILGAIGGVVGLISIIGFIFTLMKNP